MHLQTGVAHLVPPVEHNTCFQSMLPATVPLTVLQ